MITVITITYTGLLEHDNYATVMPQQQANQKHVHTVHSVLKLLKMTFSINLLPEYVILQYKIFVWYCGPGSNNKPFFNLHVCVHVCFVFCSIQKLNFVVLALWKVTTVKPAPTNKEH